MNTQNIETIEGAKPSLIDEQQANELIEANTQEMEELEDLLTSTQLAALAGLNHDRIVHDWLKKGHIVGWEKCQARLCLSRWTIRRTRTTYQKA